MNRSWTRYAGTEIIDSGQFDVTWEEVRKERDNLLTQTDLWYLPDRWDDLTNEQQESINNYRESLRQLPQNYSDSPNDAADNFPNREDWY